MLREIKNSQVTREEILIHPPQFDTATGNIVVTVYVRGYITINGYPNMVEEWFDLRPKPCDDDEFPNSKSRPHEA